MGSNAYQIHHSWIVKEHLSDSIPFSQVEGRIKESRKEERRVWNKLSYKARCGSVSLVIVDYVQLIEPMRRERGENRVQEIDSILKQLRAIAKQFNCAVLGLAQLKREVDSRSEKRPTKADFRESGGFEQEAAVMLGLYREDYYDKQATQKGIFEVSVLKSRFSSETTVNLLFDERFGQFKNLAKPNY
ncbi:DnaB-like helicase C-terminal domain-containing protein [Nostoc punctiforme UO1]|uniref:DnaB-like helicase C-terminal domain-containing protein n=1 Tax=Nostoc punctiforme TaxID=272131 RepID=UPI003095BB5F